MMCAGVRDLPAMLPVIILACIPESSVPEGADETDREPLTSTKVETATSDTSNDEDEELWQLASTEYR